VTDEEFEKITRYTMESPRNYLQEAYAILRGETMMLPIREHLQALADRVTELAATLEPRTN
jgi:hypothetical protein